MTTGEAGHFDVSETHGGDLRQFKVEILFDSDRLRIKQGQETSIKLDSSGFPLDVDFDRILQSVRHDFRSRRAAHVHLKRRARRVLKYPAKGISEFMNNDDSNFYDFLARAGAILPDFTVDKIRRVKSYLDPNSTINPLAVGSRA